jgi:hypothetical protein
VVEGQDPSTLKEEGTMFTSRKMKTITQQHSVTSQKSQILNKIDMKTSNLAQSIKCSDFASQWLGKFKLYNQVIKQPAACETIVLRTSSPLHNTFPSIFQLQKPFHVCVTIISSPPNIS